MDKYTYSYWVSIGPAVSLRTTSYLSFKMSGTMQYQLNPKA